ncbi:hypothetical protein ACS0TY_026008 [Phlomoides rotata]
MEQSPPPPLSLFPDSGNSSPRSRPDTTWDDHPLPSNPGAKLRLMCSYGGHIIPRPHDKSLCYVGGDTRIVVVDRQSSLAELHSRLSHTLLNGRHFSLKYQLPSEDLDSLISIATDEDLENMMEEYDRSAAAKPSRLRLFLFPSKPESTASMGSLLDDAKSETWFVDALNGSGGLLPRVLSESAAMDTLVELDDHGVGNSTDSCTDLEAPKELNNKQQAETNSSFGSSSSSPSMANLPPIKVRGSEDYLMVGLDEQFSQAKLGAENWDEKSGVMRKPPLPLQRKFVDTHNLPSPDSKHSGPHHNLPSPDSVASDNGSVSKQTIYHDATPIMNRENRVSTPVPSDPNINSSNIINQDPNSQPPPQQNQQQFIPNTHYISSYYPTMYLHPQTQQSDPQMQYPMYVDVATMKPEMGAASMQQVMVQVPAGHQFQQQQQQHYIGVSQIPPPSVQYSSNLGTSNYGYEYSPHQGYYAQQLATSAPPPPSQYQTMTPAAALMFSQHASAQLPPDNSTAHQS